MREKLQELYNKDRSPIIFEAEVGFRRSGNVRFASKPSMQRLLLNVTCNGEPVTDHLILTVGKEIPAVPLIYSRIVPGMLIKFEGKIFPYVRKLDNTHDFSVNMVKLLESKQVDRNLLREAWVNRSISSKEYLNNLKR